jgi:hypothetical protein
VQVHLGWPAFAAAYRAELEQWPLRTRLAVVHQIVGWLRTAPTVTVLSFERSLSCEQMRLAAEHLDDPGPAWAQRHVFRDWLVSLLDSREPPGVANVRTEPGGAVQRGKLVTGG